MIGFGFSLAGLRSGGTLAAYSIGGVAADLVVDFSANTFAQSNEDNMILSDILTSAGTSARTVIDIDGLMKWALHNLFLNSATGATQGVTVVSGGDYTIGFKGTGSITYSGAASGTLNGTGVSDLVTVEVTASTTTLTCTVSGSITDVRVYRSDLGGMQLNSDGTDYVATGGSAVYFPGVDHDANGVALGIQSFEERENVVLHSRDISNAAWTTTNAATLAVDATGLDGETSAVTIVDSGLGGTGAVTVWQNVTVATSTEYTLSADLKAAGNSWAFLRLSGFTTPTDGGAWFDLGNGSVGTENTDCTGKITPLANGFYRCEMTFTTDAADTSGRVWLYVADEDNDSSVALDGTSSIIVDNLQLEVGNRAGPRIVTEGTAVTQPADDLSKLISSFGYDQTEGTVVIEFYSIEDLATASRRPFSLNDGTTDNRIELYHTSAERAYVYVVSGAVVQANIGSTETASLVSKNRVAFAYAANDFAISLNGGAVSADTSGTPPTVTTLMLGSGVGQDPALNGYVAYMAYYPTRISDAKLVEVSAV